MTVGIDLDDGALRAVAVSAAGKVVARTAQARDGEPRASHVRDALGALGEAATEIEAVGFTLPFQADGLAGDIAQAVAEVTGKAPVTVSAGQAMALAESWCGAAAGRHHVVALDIGEHVTAGIVSGGQLLRGAGGHAGAIAWLALNPVEREDYRRYGGLEAEVATAGIVRRLVWLIKTGDSSSVLGMVGDDLSRLTAEDVFNAARAGDGVCQSVIRDTARYLGMAVANLAAIVDPDCVVLGGTLGGSSDLMLDAIRVECSRRARPAQSERLEIVLSALGDDAGAIGAARAAGMPRE